MIKKFFKDWNLFEKILLFGSILIVSTISIIFKSDVITAITSLAGIATALLLAKGKVVGQFFGIMIVILYSYVSFQNRYYGEMLIYTFIMWLIPVINGNLLVLPMMFNPIINLANDLYGWVNWTRMEKVYKLDI